MDARLLSSQPLYRARLHDTQSALGPEPRAPVSVMPAARLVVVAKYRRGQLRPGRPYLQFARRAGPRNGEDRVVRAGVHAQPRHRAGRITDRSAQKRAGIGAAGRLIRWPATR